jgi:phenylacetate-CoA ligase
MLEPEVEARPWAEQLAADDAAYREQLAYLFERSAFYREKLAAAGFESAEAAGGLADVARLPPTEKGELKATATADNPIGAHLCAARSEIVRIYSTSGTTGTPLKLWYERTTLKKWYAAVEQRMRRVEHGLRQPAVQVLRCLGNRGVRCQLPVAGHPSHDGVES